MTTVAQETPPRAPAHAPSPAMGEVLPLVLRLAPVVSMTDDQFADLCALNDILRLERTAAGDLELMPPAFSETGSKNSYSSIRLGVWAEQDGTGHTYDSSAGFTLPNGAIRSPDASWISNARYRELTSEQRSGFSAICPNFVIELRSHSDRLSTLQAKMQEYMANGAQLGWLIDPSVRSVHVYRPNTDVQVLENPNEVSADPELPDFTLNLQPIWESRS